MTDAEIIKALECCTNTTMMMCDECPYSISFTECGINQMKKDALDLIKRYKTKDEQLDKAIQQLELEIMRMKNNAFCNVVIDEETMRNIINEKMAEFELDIESIKAEAIKEFAERLHDLIHSDWQKIHQQIDNLVKEMVGE